MAQHARVEELSDTDSDPPDMDPSDFDPSQLIAPSSIPYSSSAAAQARNLGPSSIASRSSVNGVPPERAKHWQCLYPIYFDASRSRAEGRRVGKELAVANPLAREMFDAVQAMDLKVVFEPGKTHPKDWSNPGRVKVLLKEDGKRISREVKNSEFNLCRCV
jgi:signal recognition particle subunit SRP19